MSEGSKDDGIKVVDHRRFDSEGHVKPGAEVEGEGARPAAPEAPASGPEAGEGPAPGKEGARPSGGGSAGDGARTLPNIDFPTFVLSLASSAQVHLGLVPDPGSGVQSRNLALAKETIDLLGLMEEKTKGNLTADEDGLLKQVLYELRMIYVEFSKAGNK